MNEDISKECFEKLISSFNNLKDDENLIIYLDSDGGDVDYAEAIIHLINQNCERMILVAHGDISSAAFDIFFRTVCERKVLPGTNGMAHHARVGVNIVGDNKALDEWTQQNVCWSKKDAEKRVTYYTKLGFTDKEIKLFKKRRDVCFNDERLNDLLSNHIKLINAEYK